MNSPPLNKLVQIELLVQFELVVLVYFCFFNSKFFLSPY